MAPESLPTDWLFAVVLLVTMSCNVLVALYERRHAHSSGL